MSKPNVLRSNSTIGFILPEGFIYLDEKGYIQNERDIPVIYHYPRRISNKKIIYAQNLEIYDPSVPWRYNTKIPNKENLKKERKKSRYWWLAN